MLPRLLLAGFLLAHALIHTFFFIPQPEPAAGAPAWPFDLGRSWLLSPTGLDPAIARTLALALLALTIAGFALAALVAIDALPASLFAPAMAVGAVASIALLVVFFHPWLVLGVAIDLVLLWAAWVVRWTPESIGA